MNEYLQEYNEGIHHSKSKTSFEYTDLQTRKFLTKEINTALAIYLSGKIMDT